MLCLRWIRLIRNTILLASTCSALTLLLKKFALMLYFLVQEEFEQHVQNTEAEHAAALEAQTEQFAEQLAQKDAELQEAIAQACAWRLPLLSTAHARSAYT